MKGQSELSYNIAKKRCAISGSFGIVDRFSRRRFIRCCAWLTAGISGLWIFKSGAAAAGRAGKPAGKKEGNIMLKPPLTDGKMSLEEAIKRRRTIRSFQEKPVTEEQFSQIFWSAQGITDEGGFKRAAPSGGALYPADVYACAGKGCVNGLSEGIYHYISTNHSIEKIKGGDKRGDLGEACLGQMWMARAPVIFVLTAEYERITGKYGNRGIRYALIEIGHIGQNIFLQCQALGLSAGIVGAFDDRMVGKVMDLEKDYRPLIVMPVGWA
jgi:SagB-type dehydrogenase family enzyme